MELVLQLSLVTVTVCIGAAVVVLRTVARSDTPIDVGAVSSGWLSEYKVRGRQHD